MTYISPAQALDQIGTLIDELYVYDTHDIGRAWDADNAHERLRDILDQVRPAELPAQMRLTGAEWRHLPGMHGKVVTITGHRDGGYQFDNFGEDWFIGLIDGEDWTGTPVGDEHAYDIGQSILATLRERGVKIGTVIDEDVRAVGKAATDAVTGA